jgi:hypothetical protein
VALELTLDIVANGAQARGELRAVEGDIKRVENATKSNVSWWQKEEQAIDEVTGTLDHPPRRTVEGGAGAQKMETQVANAAKTTGSSERCRTHRRRRCRSRRRGGRYVATALLGMVGASELSVGAHGDHGGPPARRSGP